MGYGKGYLYAHDYGGKVHQQHLPDDLVGRRYYRPGANGVEPRLAPDRPPFEGSTE
jgi:putative ATPase